MLVSSSLVLSLVTVAACAGASADEPTGGGNSTIESFSTAKKYAAKVYSGHRRSFYCDCTYSKGKKLDHASCGYQPVGKSKRAHRIEWEHVVPAEAFGKSFSEWRDGRPECVDRRGRAFKGRNCARKTNRIFRRMEADLYNLVPAVGEVNARRSNFSMSIIEGEVRAFGTCDVEIAGRKIEPRPAIRGDVARIYLYMDAAYPGRGIVSRKTRKLFAAWSIADPVDAWECQRARRIAKVQRSVNVVVDAACRESGLLGSR